MNERVTLTYNDGTRTREIRGELKECNSHIAVVLNPEELDNGEWKPVADLEKIELNRRYVVSVGYRKPEVTE